MNRRSISHPDFILIAELSVFVKVSIAFITFSRNSATVPKEFCLIYSSRVLIAATAGDNSSSFERRSLK
jgi:hypothetical protein